jgi:hypothetical protein
MFISVVLKGIFFACIQKKKVINLGNTSVSCFGFLVRSRRWVCLHNGINLYSIIYFCSTIILSENQRA